MAALHLAGRLHSALGGSRSDSGSGGRRRQRLIRWCMARQGSGYTGRANKPVDSCYAFWLGASLQLLTGDGHTRPESNLRALMECFDVARGGFGKEAELLPDIMHSYLGTLGAAIIQHALLQQKQVSHVQPRTDDAVSVDGQPLSNGLPSAAVLSLTCLAVGCVSRSAGLLIID